MRSEGAWPALAVDRYQCVCGAGFAGENCATDVDECAAPLGILDLTRIHSHSSIVLWDFPMKVP